MSLSLTAIILTKNSQATLAKTLESLSWVDTLLILDDGSTDETTTIARHYKSHIHSATQPDFAGKRTEALKFVSTDWVVYIDADEVVTPQLQAEITSIVTRVNDAKQPPNITAYTLPRRNFFLGTEMYPDRVHRLFYRSSLKSWQGKVHETPEFTGLSGELKEPLLHYTHTDITSMLTKTNEWSEMEAQLRLQAKHPPVAWWRLVRIGVTFFVSNYLGKKLYRYGRAGLFESYFQMIDKLIVYVKLWEMQHVPKINPPTVVT